MSRGSWRAAAAGAIASCACAHAAPSHHGGDGLFDVLSADVPGAGSWSAAVTGVGYRIHASQEPGATQDRRVWDGGVQVGASFGGWLETWGRYGATLYSDQGEWPIAPSDGSAGAKVALPWRNGWARTGVSARLHLPWGSAARGLSTDALDPNVSALFTFRLPESNPTTTATLHVNVGHQWHRGDGGRGFDGVPPYYLEPVYPGEAMKDRWDLRAAVELVHEDVTLFLELLLDRLTSDGLSFGESPHFVTPGFRYRLGNGVAILAGSKIALAQDDASTDRYRAPEDVYPDWQIVLGLSWSIPRQRADHDDHGPL